MSGGRFENRCLQISQFAEQLKHEIETNTVQGAVGYTPHYSDRTVRVLTACQRSIETAGKLAKEIERLYSGDHGEERFCHAVVKALCED